MKTSLGIALLMITALTSCGTPEEPSDTDVTSSEVRTFQTQVRAQAPRMRQFTDPDDFKMLAESVCGSFDGGQSYGLVSKTVAAYVRAEPSDQVVDTVIRVAVGSACPTMKDAATGLA